ncbi:cell adhesion molecule 2-like isoform X2 [Neocloeon triangulifer]|uniref:cell adhesion molecule 2-like isoform X2 n=1 Tax=Neocloeon triangulifer TaxID=2078957 RepID=UPI00286FA6E2|nr:cell adhesion molecule 2-like isoform X2 [Neocloeon triangulifer]
MNNRHFSSMYSIGYLVALLCITCIQGVLGMQLMEVRIPKHIARDESARLECKYDLGQESLYSVKWYKDGNEFYRYVPQDRPPTQIFTLPGVTVDLHNSSESTVVLTHVDLSSSGVYRCEVSAEAPSFQTVSERGDMTVVAMPKDGPRISGGRPRYQIGDMVRVNCTSARSKPAATLQWFINSELADSNFLRGPYYHVDSDDLETSTLGLEFKVKPRHFRKSDMKLKCLATIASVYWRSNEESVEGEKPREAVMESRGTAPPTSNAASSASLLLSLLVISAVTIASSLVAVPR